MSSELPDLESLILKRGQGYLAAAKPAGWETIAEGGGKRCFSSLLRRGLKIQNLRPAHRLDRDTTGVQLFSTDPKSKSNLERQFRQRETKKSYLAICFGAPQNLEGTISRNLSAWTGGRRPVQVMKGRGGQEAVTAYRVLVATESGLHLAKTDPDASLILFEPHHGRTHQIRVHASALGHPVLGDDQYGERPANRIAKEKLGLSRQALHAWRLGFFSPENGSPILVEAPLAADMIAACDVLFPAWQTHLPERTTA